MLGLRIGYLSTIALVGFPNTAKSGDEVSGEVRVGNPLQYTSMWVETIVFLGNTKIFDNYVEIPASIEKGWACSFTMPNNDATLTAQNYWMEPETGDLLIDSMTIFKVKLDTGGPSKFPWKYVAIGGGFVAVLGIVLLAKPPKKT